MFGGLFRRLSTVLSTWINYVSTFTSFYSLLTPNYKTYLDMAPRNRFESEYKANFKPHEVTPVSSKQPQPQVQHDDEEMPRNVLKKKEDLLKPPRTSKMKENRALQHKAGLQAPPMKTRDRLRYQSEYNKQFDWKKPLEQEAPILSAEKMIYGVHGDEHPVKASKVKMPKKTEYQLQFVKHPIVSSPEARKDLLDKHLIEWKEPSVPAGKPSSKPSHPSPPVPRKTMTFQSEYRANFKSPIKYEYIKGAWVRAEHPHIPHPNKVSDSETKQESSSIHPWYQQVIELREKVRIYKARAREGSHFINLLKNLKENGFLVETEDTQEKPGKRTGTPSKTAPRKPQESDVGQPYAGDLTIPTNDDQVKQPERVEKMKHQAQEAPPKTKAQPPTDHSEKIIKRSLEGPSNKTRRQLAFKQTDPENSDDGKDEYLWNKKLDLPGPSLKKTHSIDTISHESTVASTTTLESSPNNEREMVPRREAWPEYKPARGLVIPPYGVSSSSATIIESDSRSEISLSNIEASVEDDSSSAKEPECPAISRATRKLFTGRRQDPNDIKRVDFSSSDDERSVCSYSSKGSGVLSVEAMEKRRAMASETLQRARRRQAQL